MTWGVTQRPDRKTLEQHAGQAAPARDRRCGSTFDRAGQGGLAAFLAQAALLATEGDEDAAGRLTLATVHAAKGLEWRCVRVIGFQEELFPHARCEGEAGLEEERRLAYVAMTRAREELVLTWARSRQGRRRRRASRFVAEAGVA